MKRGILALVMVLAGGCAVEMGDAAETEDIGATSEALRGRRVRDIFRGARVFQHETFDGNGRTCGTCHRLENNGTIDPEFLATLPPSDPIFRAIDSDDGTGASYNQLLNRATVNVTLRLPPYLRQCDDLESSTYTVRRSVPTVENVALDDVFNWDLSASDLPTQASGAVFQHFEPGRAPTDRELEQLSAFQSVLFSSSRLRRFAWRGREPQLPEGRTEAEQRGREHFLPEGRCGVCHSGPMLNELSEFHPGVLSGVREPGERADLVLVGTLGTVTQQPRFWCVLNPAGEVVVRTPVPFPDPGIAVTRFPNRPGIIGGFKIPTLWDVEDTGPYFHDNSASTLEEVMDHYNLIFAAPPTRQFGPPLTPDETTDALAYLRLLSARPRRRY